MSDFVGEQSRVHIMPISAKWKHKSSIHIGFIVFNGGVTTFLAKSVCTGHYIYADCNLMYYPSTFYVMSNLFVDSKVMSLVIMEWKRTQKNSSIV